MWTVNFLFNYQPELLGQKRSAPIVIKGSRRWIEQFIPLKEFGDLFGGYVLWRPPDQKTAQMPDEAVGVWGKRNISKLRRILWERGASFESRRRSFSKRSRALSG